MRKIIFIFLVITSLIGESLKEKLISQINNLKNRLPLKYQSGLLLVDANLKNNTLKYTYKFENISLNLISPLIRESMNLSIKANALTLVCTTIGTKEIVKEGFVIDYEYLDKDGKRIIEVEIDKRKCDSLEKFLKAIF